jgi:hypothetical protein
MSLATEETKTTTVWTDNRGTSWDSREAAEHKSVANALDHYSIRLNPSYLVNALKQEPEAKQWLLEQLGVQPATYTVPSVEQLRSVIISLDASHIPSTTDKASYLQGLLSRLPSDNTSPVSIDRVLLEAYRSTSKEYGSFNIYQVSYWLQTSGYQLIKK